MTLISLLSFLPGLWVSDISHDSDSAMPLKTGLEKVKDRIESLPGKITTIFGLEMHLCQMVGISPPVMLVFSGC